MNKNNAINQLRHYLDFSLEGMIPGDDYMETAKQADKELSKLEKNLKGDIREVIDFIIMDIETLNIEMYDDYDDLLKAIKFFKTSF